MPTLTRRATTAGLAAAALAAPALAQQPVPFRVGIASPSTTFLAIWMADTAGLDRKSTRLNSSH